MWTLFHTRKILIIYLTGLNCPLFTHHNLCLRTHFLFLCNEHQRNRSEHIRLNLHRNCMSESVALQKVCHREKKCQIFSYQWLLASMRWRQKWYSYDFEMFFFFHLFAQHFDWMCKAAQQNRFSLNYQSFEADEIFAVCISSPHRNRTMCAVWW